MGYSHELVVFLCTVKRKIYNVLCTKFNNDLFSLIPLLFCEFK